MKTFNFIHESLPESDKELFFGPLDGTEEFITFGSKDILAHLVTKTGFFPSVNIARKNGWGPERVIPVGFSEIEIGNKNNKRKLTILNLFPDWEKE